MNFWLFAFLAAAAIICVLMRSRNVLMRQIDSLERELSSAKSEARNVKNALGLAYADLGKAVTDLAATRLRAERAELKLVEIRRGL